MKIPARIILFVLFFAIPAYLLPTEDKVQVSESDVAKNHISDDSSYDDMVKEDTIDDEDIGEGTDDHPDVAESEIEVEDHENNSVPQNCVEPEETVAVQVEASGDGQQVSQAENATTATAETDEDRKPVILRKIKKIKIKVKHGKKKVTKIKFNKRKQWNKKKKHESKRRRFNKRKQQKKWRLVHRKKVVTKRPVANNNRSSETEQYNSLVDMILQNFTATLSQNSSHEDAKIMAIPPALKILPWAYRTISIIEEAALRAASLAEEGVVETETISDNCTTAVNTTSDNTNNNKTCNPLITDNNADEVEEKEIDETAKEETETEEAEVDENNNKVVAETDEHEGEKTEEKATSKTDEVATSEDVATEEEEEDDDIYTKDPHPVLQKDGNVEYYLQLVNTKLFKEEHNTEEAPTTEEPNLEIQGKDDHPKSSNSEPKKHRKDKHSAEHHPWKKSTFNVLVTGIDKIKRRGDVRIVDRKTVKILRIPVSVGPLKLEFTESAPSEFNQTSVITNELPALLVLKESKGRLTASRFVSKSARVHQVQVNLRRSHDDEAPAKSHAAALVTHLTQEAIRLWNREFLLSKINREFKDLFVAKKDKKKKHEKYHHHH